MQELFAIIPKLPGVKVFVVTSDRASCEPLAKYCVQNDHYLEIVTFDKVSYYEIQGLQAKIRCIDEEKERYNLRSMQFDTIFILYDIHKLKNREEFFKKIYRMSKNAGDIIFFVEKEEVEEYQQLLEKLNFVAINPIEVENKIALTAKKMHGWTKV